MMPQPDGPLSTGTLVLPRQGPSVPQQGSSAPPPAIAPTASSWQQPSPRPPGGSTLRCLAGLVAFAAAAHRQTPSLRALGYSGVNPWDRTRAAGLKDGSWRYRYEDVVTAAGVTAGEAMLAAKAPLAGGTVYHVRVSGHVQVTAGGPWRRLRTRTWSFTTA
jgi:hypothetical protein